MPATPIDELAANSACFTCLGVSIEASFDLALWDQVSQNIAPSIPAPVQSFIDRSGITDGTQIAALITLYENAVAHGWWDKCDFIYPFVGGNATAHAQNLKSASYTITWFGTVTHNANGITGNGTTGYGDTGYIPSSGPLWALNSSHFGVYRRTGGSNATYLGAVSAGSFSVIGRTTNATSLNGAINSGGVPLVIATADLAWNVITRIGAADFHGYSAAVDATIIAASTVVTARSAYVLARNIGSPSLFNSVNLAGATAGSGLTFSEYGVMAADWQTFNTSLGRQV